MGFFWRGNAGDTGHPKQRIYIRQLAPRLQKL